LLSPSVLQATAKEKITAIEVYCKDDIGYQMDDEFADEMDEDAGSKTIGIGDSEENVHYDNNKARDDFTEGTGGDDAMSDSCDIDNTTENTSETSGDTGLGILSGCQVVTQTWIEFVS
jgi:hypothetical protein